MSVIEKESAASNDEEQLVALRLADETYGVDISKIYGIIAMQEITKIPRSPHSVCGVINLRGKVIPVVDLRRRFDLAVSDHTKETRIVIVEIDDQTIGMVVDAVTEVLRIPADAIEPPSQIATGVGADYIRGVGKLEGRLIILLDIDKVFGTQDIAAAESAQAEASGQTEAPSQDEPPTGSETS